MQLVLQLNMCDFLELDELCKAVENVINQKITVTNYIEMMIQEELMMKNDVENNLKYCSIEKGEGITSG